ncbi:MAG: hypothetical protein FWD47_06605 [Treponema sp.]|nr:hypothetical protein [Treponema sp.]
MKKITILFIFLLFIGITGNIMALEMQISGGVDLSFVTHKVENTIVEPLVPPLYFGINYANTASFTSIGISFLIRVFPDDYNAFSTGFVFRDRAVFSLGWKENGHIDGIPHSGKFKSKDGMYSIMDFGVGLSQRFLMTRRFSFYTDLGVNFTIMDFDDFEDSTINYWGAGMFADLSMQINFSQKIYLELGVNSVLNAFSSSKGNILDIEFKDSGRWDYSTVTAYLHIGWRYDLGSFR